MAKGLGGGEGRRIEGRWEGGKPSDLKRGTELREREEGGSWMGERKGRKRGRERELRDNASHLATYLLNSVWYYCSYTPTNSHMQ